MEEGEKVIGEIIKYAKEYLDYASSLRPGEKYGLDYPIGINVQALKSIYDMAINLKIDSLASLTGAMLNNYGDKL